MTVFTARVKKDLLDNEMTSLDAVNVVRGGTISAPSRAAGRWTYRATTQRMTVGVVSKRESKADAIPDELVLEAARRTQR
jgi:hypothetical protein